MKKRTKLVSLFAAVAGAATLATSPASAADANRFVHVSSHATFQTHSVTITEWKVDSAGNPIAGAKDVFTASQGDSWYWPVNVDGVSYITLQEGDQAPHKFNTLPACFRISSSGDLHPADGSCTPDGHRVVWNG